MQTIEIPVDEALHANARQVLANEGLTISQALGMFLQTVVHNGTLPNLYRVPNERTLAAIREADEGNLPRASTVEEFMRALREDD